MRGSVIEVTRSRSPFPRTGLTRDVDGIGHYLDVPATLVEMLYTHVQMRPDTEAVVEIGGARLTYAQLWERAERVAGGLRSQGVQPGHRVALRYPAGVDWVIAFWGIALAGGVAVVVNTRSTQPEVDYVLRDSDVTRDIAADTVLPDGDPYVADGVAATDVAALFYTSGTTGRPKGVPTTHEAFITNAENMIRCLGVARDSGPQLRTLISVPLFHVTGCNSQLLVAAYLGGTSVIMPALDLPKLIETLTAEQISYMVTVPAVYALLLRHPNFAHADVSALHTVAYGGAPIAPSLVQALRAAFPQAKLMNGYGMTETASLLTVLPDTDADEHADSVGYAVPSVDLGVIPFGDDPNVGELVVRGANVTTAYWNKPEANTETIVDGWLHTGDVVRVDEAGRVHIIDRMKDIINRGGENVSSVEVEAVLLSAPGVDDAAVLPVPDDVMGEKVGAVLLADPVEIDIDTVLAHCREHLADFKIPQYAVVVTDALPRNASGKLLKNQLREQLQWGDPLR